MIFYFSGLKRQRELALIESGAGNQILVDIYDLPQAQNFTGHIALDSGAYKNFKANRQMPIVNYLHQLDQLDLSRFDFITSLDVIGDPGQTLANWETAVSAGYPLMPVWGWNAPQSHLHTYLDRAQLVGIGDLVMPLRDKGQRDKTLKDLVTLCQQFPGRFHAFGLHWPKAIHELNDLLVSADSSTWLRGRKRRLATFINTRTHKLSQAPASFITDFKHHTPEQLCIHAVQTIQSYCQNGGSHA